MRLASVLFVSLAFQLAALGQVVSSEAPVPSDPLELVTGAAQPVTNAAERATAINLIEHARAHSNVRFRIT